MEKTPLSGELGPRWSREKANEWYEGLPWLTGCNYIPSTAINQLEMWQAETFDPERMDVELGWAEELGFNTMRVYLHDKAWKADAAGFKGRIGQFLDICGKHRIRPVLVIFDDCWAAESHTGKQPEPKPGVHNSGWVQSPGAASVDDPATWPGLEEYFTDILTTFAKDDRVLLWDIYNEPGNYAREVKPMAFLRSVFAWARAVNPSQPLSVGVWKYTPDFAEINEFQLENSDVITFHNYLAASELEKQIRELRAHGRPLLCTEYMARTNGSTFQGSLPVLKRERVGAINWGFVSGKTNTIFPWETKEGSPEPKVWFHDVLRDDGSPFDPAEVRLIKELNGRCA